MKNSRIIIICFILLFQLNSCNNSTSTPDYNSDFNGFWHISGLESNVRVVEITTTSNELTFDGLKYNGTYTENTFNGKYSKENLISVLYISLTNNKSSINGTLLQTIGTGTNVTNKTYFLSGNK